ncbi:MAG: hypothetical protein KGY40_05250, partial [Thioalkalivibrio sp.]|nr:hypothetical protein [Thioalkalivibrio sp.]
QPLVRGVWDLARRADAHPDVVWAEAAVIQPGHDPDPGRVGRTRQRKSHCCTITTTDPTQGGRGGDPGDA